MILCLDIGNSRTKWGIYHHDKLVHKGQYRHFGLKTFHTLLRKYEVEGVIFSSVIVLDNTLMEALRAVKAIELDHQTPMPIQLDYSTPESLGKDRIAAAVGVFSLYPNSNSLVIDIGTCITYDLISDQGIFKGGNISPGLDMRLRSLNHYTSRLPLVERYHHKRLLGNSTVMAIQNGAVQGILSEIEGMIGRVQNQVGQVNIILTGGDSSFFVRKLKTKIFVSPFLVLYGLYRIFQFNVGRHE